MTLTLDVKCLRPTGKVVCSGRKLFAESYPLHKQLIELARILNAKTAQAIALQSTLHSPSSQSPDAANTLALQDATQAVEGVVEGADVA